jgi:hypothetical protein
MPSTFLRIAIGRKPPQAVQISRRRYVEDLGSSGNMPQCE